YSLGEIPNTFLRIPTVPAGICGISWTTLRCATANEFLQVLKKHGAGGATHYFSIMLCRVTNIQVKILSGCGPKDVKQWPVGMVSEVSEHLFGEHCPSRLYVVGAVVGCADSGSSFVFQGNP